MDKANLPEKPAGAACRPGSKDVKGDNKAAEQPPPLVEIFE